MFIVIALLTVGLLLNLGDKQLFKNPQARMWGFIGCILLWGYLLWQNFAAHEVWLSVMDGFVMLVLAWDVYKMVKASKQPQDKA